MALVFTHNFKPIIISKNSFLAIFLFFSQQHLPGKTQGFGSNPDNFNIFNNNNMHLYQHSPPLQFDQQQQNCHQQYANNFNFDESINSPNIGMKNYNEANCNLKVKISK